MPETCTCIGSEGHFANMAVAIDRLKMSAVTAACTTLFYSTTIQSLTWYFYSTTFILVTLQILINTRTANRVNLTQSCFLLYVTFFQ